MCVTVVRQFNGFGEADQEKSVCIVDLRGRGSELERFSMVIQQIAVPRFQELKQIKGDWNHISDTIDELADSNAWLEVVYEERRSSVTCASGWNWRLKDRN